MKITADTNVLLRAAVYDDERQATLAAEALQDATVIALPLPSLCEFVWVLAADTKERISRLPRQSDALSIVQT